MITGEDLFTEDFDDNGLETIEGNQSLEVVDDNDAEPSGETQPIPVKPKRIVRNPQPKLNAETLSGKRGLVALEPHFERVKFKGRGHEEEDLNVILKTYEYWCHRLFPKFPFDACIDKLETLGTKRPVISLVKRIRSDMVLEDVEDRPIVSDNESDEDMPNINLNDAPMPNLDHLNDAAGTDPPQLTEEQMEQIRINKERALRIRQEKMRQQELAEVTSDPTELPSTSRNGVFDENKENMSQEAEPMDDPQSTSRINSHTSLTYVSDSDD